MPAGPAAWPPPAGEAAKIAGWLKEEDGRIRLTPEGWLRLDQLVTSLTTSPGGG